MALTDRVRMRAKSTFNNPLISVHRSPDAPVADIHTVDVDDEFSTHEEHAAELERAGFAERTKGEAAPASERAERLSGSQISNGGAIASNRKATETSLKA
jgi:hypothetical protein